MGLSSVLKSRRTELGMTLREVANLVGVSEGTVQRWESGNIKNLRHDRISRLAEVLEVSPAVLMGWIKDDDMTPPAVGGSKALNDTELGLVDQFRTLNQEGQEKVLVYVNDLIQTGIYKNHHQSGLVSEDA